MVKIKFIDRKKNADMLILPGWSFDYKIFEYLHPDFNLIVYDNFSADDFIISFREFFGIFKSTNELAVMAWSMGSFLCCDLLKSLNEYLKIKKIFVVSASIKFNEDLTDSLATHLIKNKNEALENFYKKIFFGDRKMLAVFNEKFRDYYLNLNELDNLLESLEYLKKSELNTDLLNNYDTVLIHSEKDIISPFGEYDKIKTRLTRSSSIIVKHTHTPFLYDEVIDDINKKFYTS